MTASAYDGSIATGRPEEAIPDILSDVDALIGESDVEQFYIGRTVNPEATISRHDADELRLVYETTSLDFVMAVEDALIGEYRNHPKCNNDEPSSAGGTPEAFDRCYAYVAIWRERR